jgi:hypothetical protein
LGIYGCAANQPCATKPVAVVEGLQDGSVLPTNIASDGARVYFPRYTSSDVVGVDGVGATTVVATGVQATALAVDAATGDVFYGTSDGAIRRAKSDGSGQPTTLSTCWTTIHALAFDTKNVYALVSTDPSIVYAIAR